MGRPPAVDSQEPTRSSASSRSESPLDEGRFAPGTVLAAQGYDATPEEVMLVGERLTNVARVWNVRAGFTRADDTLPDRLLMEPLKTGASQGHRISPEDRDFMLNEYYSLRGWDAKGVPTPDRLKALGLGALAADLPRA